MDLPQTPHALQTGVGAVQQFRTGEHAREETEHFCKKAADIHTLLQCHPGGARTAEFPVAEAAYQQHLRCLEDSGHLGQPVGHDCNTADYGTVPVGSGGEERKPRAHQEDAAHL